MGGGVALALEIIAFDPWIPCQGPEPPAPACLNPTGIFRPHSLPLSPGFIPRLRGRWGGRRRIGVCSESSRRSSEDRRSSQRAAKAGRASKARGSSQ